MTDLGAVHSALEALRAYIAALLDALAKRDARIAAAIEWIQNWPQHEGTNAELIEILEGTDA